MTEIEDLRKLSAVVGSDPLLVQAAGGNTSLKNGDVMWIKASGTWLRDAETRDIFVPLDMPALQRALAADDPDTESCLPYVRNDLNANGLRPSIETSVHGLMPQRVVIHVHCVSTIARAIVRDAEAELAPLLRPYQWAFVPYARPGRQLSRAIRQHMREGVNVLVLGNHGLAVAGDSVAEAENLLRDVVNTVTIRPRPGIAPELSELERLAEGTAYRLPHDPECHAAATDPVSSRYGLDRVYYPDHVVFLGASLPQDMSSRAMALAFPGRGVLIHKDAKPAVEPMVRCLGDVFRRVHETVVLQALTEDDIGALLNWDAEKYRQTLKT